MPAAVFDSPSLGVRLEICAVQATPNSLTEAYVSKTLVDAIASSRLLSSRGFRLIHSRNLSTVVCANDFGRRNYSARLFSESTPIADTDRETTRFAP
jgi:hypothetical protein